MKVCAHRDLVIAILTRNEHSPPHVHAGTDKWDARFQFSFWHNGVQLWDVVPTRHAPSASLLEALREVLKRRANLRRARKLWWRACQTACLENLQWDPIELAVVSPKDHRTGALAIRSAHFDTTTNRTLLLLADQLMPLEIQL
jgi:hypothetical protein